MRALETIKVGHFYPKKRVLYDINIDIPPGQFVSLVGPSGCGKSTLLKAILGTHPPKEGEIYAEGFRVLEPTRNVGIVYQDYTLYDFMTAVENVAFGLEQDQTNIPYRAFCYPAWRKLRKQHIAQAHEMLDKVGLDNIADQYPGQMSGGQRQRVAIAQAIIMQPKVLLLDEPFGALDEATREELQDLLVNLYHENQALQAKGETPKHTIMIVTHELNEAIYLSDRILGLSQYHSDGEKGPLLFTIKGPQLSTAIQHETSRCSKNNVKN